MRVTKADRKFWARVVVAESDCWVWTGSRTRSGPDGYGTVFRNGSSKLAHRHAWEMVRGPIPDGLDLDHLCRVRLCINPAHLEPVTPQENSHRAALAKTHCRSGRHVRSEANIYQHRSHRTCRECWRESYLQANRKYKAKARAK